MKLASNNSPSFLSEARDEDEIDFTDYGAPFLSGHSFSLRCHWFYSPNMRQLGVNPNRDNRCVYVKTDHLKQFFSSGLVPDRFVLVTHNSDFVIDEKHAEFARDGRLELWLAMNKGVDHPKIKSIPDGLQNVCHGFGNPHLVQALSSSLDSGLHYSACKTRDFHACYTIDSRPDHRSRCASVCQAQGISLDGRKSFIGYLADTAASRYTLCPAGSGIDSCRPWEALYLKSVPIVVKHWTYHEHVRDFGLPIATVDDWTEGKFQARNYTAKLWEEMMQKFSPEQLHMENYCARVRQLYGIAF